MSWPRVIHLLAIGQGYQEPLPLDASEDGAEIFRRILLADTESLFDVAAVDGLALALALKLNTSEASLIAAAGKVPRAGDDGKIAQSWIPETGGPPGAHATTHEEGGSDELDLALIPGGLTAAQHGVLGTGDPHPQYALDEDLAAAEADQTGKVPVGGIIMWSGTIAAIPATWALCDGTANAPGPDLRDKFVVGAKQDEAGVAKSNIEGILKVSGGASGHSHSAHADLVHAGMSIGDHTGLSHSLAIANHPDLTHPALSHAASSFTHADHAVASASHSHAALTLTHPDHASRTDLSRPSGSIASHAAGSVPSGSIASHAAGSVPSASGAAGADASFPSHSHASVANASRPSLSHSHAAIAGVSSFASSTNRSGITGLASFSGTDASGADVSVPSSSGASGANISYPSHSHASAANASGPSRSFASLANASGPSASFASGADVSLPALGHADHSVPSFSGTTPSQNLTHADHSFPSLSHQAIGDHKGTAYGTHAITQPADHGTAGTLTHSFAEPNNHVLSAHDTVSNVPNYYALAFIQRVA